MTYFFILCMVCSFFLLTFLLVFLIYEHHSKKQQRKNTSCLVTKSDIEVVSPNDVLIEDANGIITTGEIKDKAVPFIIGATYEKRKREAEHFATDFQAFLPADNNGRKLNEKEVIFLKEFYNQIKANNLKPYFFIERASNGGLRPKYKGCPIGRVYLRDDATNSIQYYIGINGRNKVIHGELEELMPYIHKWVRYVINYLRGM